MSRKPDVANFARFFSFQHRFQCAAGRNRKVACLWRIVIAPSAGHVSRRARRSGICRASTHSNGDTITADHSLRHARHSARKRGAASVRGGVDAAAVVTDPTDDSPSTPIACGRVTREAVQGAIESARERRTQPALFPIRRSNSCGGSQQFSGRHGQTVSRNRSLFAHPEHTGVNHVKLG